MAKQCKIDIFSKEELKEIVENSNTQVEVLQKLGYGKEIKIISVLRLMFIMVNISVGIV